MIIISGMMPGVHGVGRLLSYLVEEAPNLHSEKIRFVFGGAGTAGGRAFKQGRYLDFLTALMKIVKGQSQLLTALYDPTIIESDEPVLLIHFQTLGYSWCRRFFDKRKGPTWLYLVDAGFFCIQSYNHLSQEYSACLRCIQGKWHNADLYRCKPLPVVNLQARKLVKGLKQWVNNGMIRLLAENQLQAELARRHFGGEVDIDVVGLWTADMPRQGDLKSIKQNVKSKYDVVYHGSAFPAKGFCWAVEVARHCSGVEFLFPCFSSDAEVLDTPPPNNAHFRFITWETGLAGVVQEAKMVLVPSLWSGPIEGALIKSILLARAVGVADEPTTYASEIPDDVVLRLSRDPKKAGAKLAESIESNWCPREESRRKWVDTFYEQNTGLLDRLIKCCKTSVPIS